MSRFEVQFLAPLPLTDMPTYQRCTEDVADLAAGVMHQNECFNPIIEAKVTIDYMFAFGRRDDETGELLGQAITHNGCRALALTRVMPLKHRAAGRADVEILIDHNHWSEISREQKSALLDHELWHISLREDEGGLKRDDLGRPIVRIRPHDFEFGWFKGPAFRHGAASFEQQQAKVIMDQSGQLFWPDLVPVHA